MPRSSWQFKRSGNSGFPFWVSEWLTVHPGVPFLKLHGTVGLASQEVTWLVMRPGIASARYRWSPERHGTGWETASRMLARHLTSARYSTCAPPALYRLRKNPG